MSQVRNQKAPTPFRINFTTTPDQATLHKQHPYVALKPETQKQPTESFSPSEYLQNLGFNSNSSNVDEHPYVAAPKNPYQSFSPNSKGVTVKKGDSISKLLLKQGYTLEEILQKDDSGKNMLDRVAAANKLDNPDLIHVGSGLILPSKDEAKMESSSPITASNDSGADSVSLSGGLDSVQEGFNDIGSSFWKYLKGGISTNLKTAGKTLTALGDGNFSDAGDAVVDGVNSHLDNADSLSDGFSDAGKKFAAGYDEVASAFRTFLFGN